MNVQEELQSVLTEVRAKRWTPELFDRVRMLLPYTNVFNIIRQELTTDEFEEFDLEYCCQDCPQNRELILWLRKERKVRECKEKEAKPLERKPQGRQGRTKPCRRSLTREYVSSQILNW